MKSNDGVDKLASAVSDENAIKKVVREVVREELKEELDAFKMGILDGIDDKNQALRFDIAKMKDEIIGELKAVREEQTVLSSQHPRLLDHEERLEKLEKTLPHSPPSGL